MSRWFRFYGESLNDPKVQRLSGDTFKLWVNLLCIASENDGIIKKGDDTAFSLRLMPEEAEEAMQSLVKRGLLEDRGEFYAPHNWDKRQYKSDNSAERVAKHRAAEKQDCNVTQTVTVTPPEADTEQSRTEKKVAQGALEKSFEDFWQAKPRRKGDNPRATARKAFFSAVKSGCDPSQIVEAARQWARQEKDATEFVPMAATWINQRRFEEYKPPPDTPTNVETEEFMRRRGFIWLNGKWTQSTAATLPEQQSYTG